MSKSDDILAVQLGIPGETNSLALVRKIVTHLAAQAGLPEEEVDKLEIAVDEACTNAMEHAYRALSPKPPLQLFIRADEESFIVDIIDQGASFDFSSYEPPLFPDHWHKGHTRGVGLFLIKQCVDETHYDVLPEQGNRLRLVKNLRPNTVSEG